MFFTLICRLNSNKKGGDMLSASALVQGRGAVQIGHYVNPDLLPGYRCCAE